MTCPLMGEDISIMCLSVPSQRPPHPGACLMPVLPSRIIRQPRKKIAVPLSRSLLSNINVFTNMQKLRNVLMFDLLLSKYFNMEKDIKTRFGVDSLGALEFSEK